MLAVSGCSWGLCWRSWAALGAYVGGPGQLLGPMLAVLGGSGGLCWRSGERIRAEVGGLGAKVVGLGSEQNEKLPKPEQEGDLAGESELNSGPNPSEKALLAREGTRIRMFSGPGPRRHCF